MDSARRFKLRRMMIEEALRIVDEIDAADRRARPAASRAHLETLFETLAMADVLAWVEERGLTDEEARALWQSKIRPALYHSFAELRPS